MSAEEFKLSLTCRAVTDVQRALESACDLWNRALEELDAEEDVTQRQVDARFEKLAKDIEALHADVLRVHRQTRGVAE